MSNAWWSLDDGNYRINGPGAQAFGSRHPGGLSFAFCDGSVRFLTYGSAPILPALATRAGGEVVSPAD